jgi:hypothetical protein
MRHYDNLMLIFISLALSLLAVAPIFKGLPTYGLRPPIARFASRAADSQSAVMTALHMEAKSALNALQLRHRESAHQE